LLALRRNPLGFLSQLSRDYGDIAHFKIGPQHVFLLNSPEFIKEVLVTESHKFAKGRGLQLAKRLLGEGLLTSEGEFHRRQRRPAACVPPAAHCQLW
jgi:cytochrome P450